MTPEEQLDEARAKEALREADEANRYFTFLEVATLAARRAREGWTPPPAVDPDILAFREWMIATSGTPEYREEVLAGKWDRSVSAHAYLAGARIAREQERERTDHPVAFTVRVMAGVFDSLDHAKREASAALAKHRGEP